MPDIPVEPDLLELRGILSSSGFELLRIHERTTHDVYRLRLHRREGLTARLTTEDGEAVAEGTVGEVSSTFDDVTDQSPVPVTRTRLVRLVLPLRQLRQDQPLMVELLDEGRVVWRERISPRRPTLRADAEVTDDALVMRWESDVDQPVDLYVRRPGERERQRVVVGTTEREARIDLRDLPGGMMTVLARTTSGLREAWTETDRVDAPEQPGSLAVLLERTTAPEGQPVTATASAVDGWGRPLDAQHVRWLLDDEPVGSGASVVLEVGAGEHRVVAELDGTRGGAADLTVTASQ